MIRRRFLAAAAFLPLAAQAQEKWPARPIKLVVPFAPGGTTDLIGRLIAPPMSARLGQQVVVDNKAGAGGMLGADSVAKAAKDAYTLGIGTVSTHAIGPALMRQPPYRPDADFAPIAVVATTPLAIFVHPSIGATLADLVDKARRQPGAYNFGSPGSGSLGHLAGLWFNSLTGGELVHVPYRGSAPALQDLLAGRIHVLFENIPTALSQVEAGTVRALAVAAPSRIAVLPAVPATREAGLPSFEILSWTMLLAPAAAPAPSVAAANEAVNAALRDDTVRRRFAEASVEPRGGSAADASAFLLQEIAKWRPMAQRSGIVLD